MSDFHQDAAKRAAAQAALAYLPAQGVIGLGSGSTSRYFIEGVAQLIKEGRELVCVPTSQQSLEQALSLGIPLAAEDVAWDIALTVDGADEVNSSLDLIKGGGAAHTREKIVSHASRKNLIVVDESKLSQKLGERWPVPIEVLAFAFHTTLKALQHWGRPQWRMVKNQPLVTDSGNYIVDLHCGVIDDPRSLDAELHDLPGVLETGLFCGRADLVLVAGPGGVRELGPTS
jgi:ribose 5-phosphate isomerase A